MSKGMLKPVSNHLISESAIVCGIAKATLGSNAKANWSQYEKHNDFIRNDIEKVIKGFDNYNEKVRKPGGFYLPNSNREGWFSTMNGKAKFNISIITSQVLASDELMMMTIRSHDQFNTTIYGNDDRYRGIENERRVILMNDKDIEKLGMKASDTIDIFNYSDGIERVARRFIIVSYNIPEQCAATYFPETNVLVPINSTAEKSNTPTSKMVIIKLKKHGG